MTDTFSKVERSCIMAKVKSKDTGPEVTFRKMLFAKGVRYRLHYHVEGKPDIVIVSKKLAIFIDGCFWHKCPKCFRAPNSKKEYWVPKIERNIRRDKTVNKALRSQNWHIIRIWEHDVKRNSKRAVNRVMKKLREIS